MKHRKIPGFPVYRIYKDGRIMNRTTGKFLKSDRHYKLIDKDGKRKSISKRQILWSLWPELIPAPKPKPVKAKQRSRKHRYSKEFLAKIQKAYLSGCSFDTICKKYNIPVGSIGYVIKKIKPYQPKVKKVVIYFD